MAADIAHGGRLIEASRRYPDAPRPFIDLSTGINPYPYPFETLPAAAFTRLPEPETLHALQAAAAAAYGAADGAMVVAAPGTQILISLLPYLLRLDRAAVLGPTYGEYGAAWQAAGASVSMHADWGSFDRQARDGKAGSGAVGAAILCNPNNPDGRIAGRERMLSLAGALANQGGVLIVDEAFADFERPDPGLARCLPHPGLLILRSFGKSYGLAGLRLGFLMASPERAASVRAALGPWAVSGAALAVGSAALADDRWCLSMRERLAGSAARIDRLFRTAGFSLVGGTLLFRLFRGSHAQSAFAKLAAAGILTRRLDYDADLLRVGLPAGDSAWSRLVDALSAL